MGSTVASIASVEVSVVAEVAAGMAINPFGVSEATPTITAADLRALGYAVAMVLAERCALTPGCPGVASAFHQICLKVYV